jgi:hypothetical protein
MGWLAERALQESSCLILSHMRYCLRSTQTLDEFSRILTFVAPPRQWVLVGNRLPDALTWHYRASHNQLGHNWYYFRISTKFHG